MPVDRTALKADTAAAAPPPAAPVASPETIAGRMAANVAAATPAVEAPAGEPAKPKTPKDRIAAITEAAGDQFPIRFNQEDMNLTVQEAQRLAQKGLLVDNIETERAALKADKQGYGAFQNFQKWLNANPGKAAHLRDVYEGRVDPTAPVAQSQNHIDDDDPSLAAVLPRQTSADPALTSRLEALEHQVQSQQAASERQSFGHRLEQAIDKLDLVQGDPDTRELAIQLASAGIANGDYPSLDAAVTTVNARLSRMVESQMESVRSRREQQATDFQHAPPRGGVPFPKLPDDLPKGPRGMRDQRTRQGLKDWISNIGRAATSGPS